MSADKQFSLWYQIPTNSLLNFKCDKSRYRKITNIIPWLIAVLSTFSGAYTQRGLYSGELIFEGNFVLVSANQDHKIYYHIQII